MKRSAYLLVCLLLLLAGAAVGVADEPAVTQASALIRGDRLAAHVNVLASDAFEGRSPGTHGETLTLNYITAAFRSAGLRPAFANGYLQTVPLLELEPSGAARFTVTSAAGAVPLKDTEDYVARFGSPKPAVRLSAGPLVFVGYGMSAPERGRDDYGAGTLVGKTVILLQGNPPDNDPKHLPAPSSKLSERLEAAARHGARAAIVVHTAASMGYPWSVLSGGGMGAKEYFLAPEPGKAALDAVVYVSEPAARRLFEAGGLDFDQAVRRAAEPGFQPVPSSLTASIDESAAIRPVESHNVAGIVPGSSRASECLVLLAHWDHMGRDPTLKGDQIFNGAVDNATGVAALIEIGRALRSLPAPRRTIVLVATTAEERGLLGSDYLAGHPVCPLRSTVGAVAIDALFPFGPWSRMTVTGFGSSELEEQLASASQLYGRKLQDDGAPQAGAFFRADNYPFAKRGVPGFLAVGGPDNAAPESDPQLKALTEYIQNRYHHPSDEYDARTWDMRGIEGDARVLFRFAWTVANDPRLPNWHWDSPYRSLGDALRASGSPPRRAPKH
jgi:Zn-dependent M28 family amino/carboxypeptidase